MAEIYNLSTIEKKRVIEVWGKTNFKKDKMTGRVDIVGAWIEKVAKKLKLKSQYPKAQILEHFQKNLPKSTFFGPVTSSFTCLQFSKKFW